MSKKKRRKKNNKFKKDFNKNLLALDEIEARREIESNKSGLGEDDSVLKKVNKSIKPKPDKDTFKKESPKKKDEELTSSVEELSGQDYFNRVILTLKKWNNIFCTGMTCKTNLKRDLIIIAVAIGLAILFLWVNVYQKENKIPEVRGEENASLATETELETEEQKIEDIKVIQDEISTENWKEYKSNWYGFKIRYPENWKNPVVLPANKLSTEVFRISFLNSRDDLKYRGFEVSIYDTLKVKDLFRTKEFPKIKNPELKDKEQCLNIEGHLIETGDYPAEEIYIPKTDDCYEPVLFFSLVDGRYIYNISPILEEGFYYDEDPAVVLRDNLPEFFVAIAQFENIEIVRPKPAPVKPKITAPKPASYKVVNGRMVCAKKNDKPGKSDRNKKKHLDMECCLDPDEYPNPHCYYDPAKYGKYLK